MDDFTEVPTPEEPQTVLTASHVLSGPPIQPLARITTYNDVEWEEFIQEWVEHSLRKTYLEVLRFSGPNDRGIDIAGFVDSKRLEGVWDNFQCKHSSEGITPGKALPEIGKIIWHSFNGHYSSPRAFYFVAPRGTGTSLTQLLSNTSALKAHVIEKWETQISEKITSTQKVLLEGDLAKYVDKFDFSIFKPLSIKTVIEQHRSSPYFLRRFGGGLPPRPTSQVPPQEIDVSESGYVTQLLDAYRMVIRQRTLLTPRLSS